MKMKQLARLLRKAEQKEHDFFMITRALPCSVTEAKTRADLKGLKFDIIEKTIHEYIVAEQALADALCLGGVNDLSHEKRHTVFHLARNSIRLGRLVTISS